MKWVRLLKADKRSEIYNKLTKAFKENNLTIRNVSPYYEIDAITESTSFVNPHNNPIYVKIQTYNDADKDHLNNKFFDEDRKVKILFQILNGFTIKDSDKLEKQIDYVDYKLNDFDSLAKQIGDKAYKFLNDYKNYIENHKEEIVYPKDVNKKYNPDDRGGYIWD